MAEFETRLAAVLARCVPGFERLLRAERLSGGASQETYRIELETHGAPLTLAMRRAPGGATSKPDPARPGLTAEAKLFQVARAAGVPEPEIVHVLEPEDGLGLGFIMQWLDGETLGSRILRAPELAEIRPRLAYQCGQILARIHAIDPAATGLDQELQTVSAEQFVRRMWDQYRGYETPQPMIDYAARWLLDHLPAGQRRTLVHNDFRLGNLMVTPAGVTAVLDWEGAHIGDPVRDLGWICTNSWRYGNTALPVGGIGTREDLLAGYRDVSGIAIDPEHVRFWEVFGSFWWAIGCLTMAQGWRHGPDPSVERPGIARRSSECQVDCVNLLIPGPVGLVAEGAPLSSTDIPDVDELLRSVRDFLRDDARPALAGRNGFLALVAANSLDIVRRELALAPAHLAGERARLEALLGKTGDLTELRWRLTHALRDGSMPLDAPGLADHLRTTAVNQLAIDQPKYSGLATALAET